MADTSFRATFRLGFEDQLSSGFRKVIAEFKQLRDLAKSLGFRPLEGADAIVGRLDRDVQQLNRDLGTTAREAETASGALRRMSAAELGRAREQAAQMRRSAQLGREISGGAGLEQIYGPGGRPLMAGGPRFVPNEEGPSSRMGWRGRATNALQGARERIGGFSDSVGLMGGALAGISLEAPIRQAAELDQTLRQIAIIQHKTGADAEAEITRLRSTLGTDALATGQPLQRLAEAYKFLLTTGMSAGAVDQLIPIHSRAATAYGVDADTMGQAVFALHDSFKIGHDEMGGALAAMAQATQEAHFDMASMSRYLPEIGGAMATMHLTGRGSADRVFAGLESVVKYATDPAEAATDYKDLLVYMTRPFAQHSFQKYAGVDLKQMFASASKQGKDPLEAFIDTLDKLTKGIADPVQQMLKLGSVLHNQQAGTAALALLNHRDEYTRMRDELNGIGADKLDQNYKVAMAGLVPELTVRAAKIKAIEQEMGLGFAWTVPTSSYLLGGVVVALTWMDTHLPGATHAVFGLTGGMLGLVAAMGVLGTVAGPVRAGFTLMTAPLRSTLGAIRAISVATGAAGLAFGGIAILGASAAIYIAGHWERFASQFNDIWMAIKQVSSGDLWAGARTASEAFWGASGIMHTLMQAFVDWLPDWAKSFTNTLGSAMQSAYAGIANIFKNPTAPFLPLPQPPQAPQGEHGGALPGPRAPAPEDLPQFRLPMSYHVPATPQGAQADVQRIHVTFEADVPGRATVRQIDSTGMARGPMLSRA